MVESKKKPDVEPEEEKGIGAVAVEIVERDEIQLTPALAAAEIDSQIATARKYPRSIEAFKRKCLTLATMDDETAGSCYYILPRAGKHIEGPSIRLAEIALSCFQNCYAQSDVSHTDGKYVYAVGSCRDLENNVGIRCTVRRRITNKEGQRFNDDMIAVTANAAASVALRNAILRVVPRAYLTPILATCKEVAAGKAGSIMGARAKMLAALANMGVDEERLLHSLDKRSIEDIDRNDLMKLSGFHTAIKDGTAELDTVFPPVPKEPAGVDKLVASPAEATGKKPQKAPKKTKRTGKKKSNLFPGATGQ